VILDKIYNFVENGLELVGCTAVEDKMQDEVEDTIKAIQKAQIKTWMLTGDKLETAMSIGYSSGLLHDNMS